MMNRWVWAWRVHQPLQAAPPACPDIMKLYYTPGACSLAVHIALREAGLEVDLVKVDLPTKKLPDGSDFLAINPLGYVPVLELDDRQRLTETSAILQYVADRVPAAGLAPALGTLERFRVQQQLAFVATELHQGFAPLFNPMLPAPVREMVMGRLRNRLAHANAQLKGNFATGDNNFSVADCYLFAVLGFTRPVGMDLGEWPALGAYVGRMMCRPTVVAAMRAEGLLG
jgi:glutathione S-transferase